MTTKKKQSRHSSFYRQADWAAARANLRYLHDETEKAILTMHGSAEVMKDLHETIHHLAINLGAADGWLHGET